jgi:hypothetical protein
MIVLDARTLKDCGRIWNLVSACLIPEVKWIL